jgi:tRNA1Val (adenine37-N6)-methyltransferase
MSEFRFKKFSLNHHPEVFKFGTDAALLATWVRTEGVQSILEIGTGSGVISLMLGQKMPDVPIVGIDRSAIAIELATKNLSNFPLPSKISFHHVPLQDFTTSQKFDLIISNPPFFESSTRSPLALKNETRHTEHLSLHDFIQHSKRLVSSSGHISFIYPSRYLDNIRSICKEEDLYLHQICYLKSKSHSPIKRILVSIGRNVPSHLEEEELIIHGDYSGYSETIFQRLEPYLLKL